MRKSYELKMKQKEDLAENPEFRTIDLLNKKSLILNQLENYLKLSELQDKDEENMNQLLKELKINKMKKEEFQFFLSTFDVSLADSIDIVGRLSQ